MLNLDSKQFLQGINENIAQNNFGVSNPNISRLLSQSMPFATKPFKNKGQATERSSIRNISCNQFRSSNYSLIQKDFDIQNHSNH